METTPRFIVSSETLETQRIAPKTHGLQGHDANHCTMACSWHEYMVDNELINLDKSAQIFYIYQICSIKVLSFGSKEYTKEV